MWSFYNKEILIGIFPSDRDWWEDQWTVWGVWCLETGEGVGGIINILTQTQCAAQLWSECAAWVWWHPREVIISHEAIVVITITIITITFHIISSGLMRLNPRNISVFSKQTWDVLTEMILIILRRLLCERDHGMGHKAHTAYRAIITRLLIGTKHYLFVRLLIKSRNKLREWD